MKKILLISILCFWQISSFQAQKMATGIKGGLNMSTLTIGGDIDKQLKMGLLIGVFTKIPITNSFSIQPELLFSSKGVKINYDESVFADGQTKFNLNYIDFPLKLVFNLSEDFNIQVGPYISFLVNAKTKTDAEVLDYFNIDSEDELNRDRFNSFDYGFTVGFGFDLDPIIIGFNYNLGFAQVAKEDDLAYEYFLGDAKNMVFQLYAGVKF